MSSGPTEALKSKWPSDRSSVNSEQQYKQQQTCCARLNFPITFAARRHNVNVLQSNSTFLIFAVLVV